MIFILITVSVILACLVTSYIVLERSEKKIISFQKLLLTQSDYRFKNFENLINKTTNFIDYEQTFLKEIVQLRSQAQKFKQTDDYRSAFMCEEKISQLAIRIKFLFEEFPILNRIDNASEIQEQILKMEHELLDMKKTYNELVIKHNRLKSSPFNAPTTNIFDRFNEKVETWKITT